MKRAIQLNYPRYYWLLLSTLAMIGLPQVALAQDAVEAGGGMMKTTVGYLIVLIGVGLGIAAVVYPTGPKQRPAKK